MINPIEEFIKNKYERRRKEVDSDSRIESARSIRIIQRDNLSGTKFIHELLQNADDACEKIGEDIPSKVEITLTNNFLIFTHNGKPFDLKEVISICTCGDPDREKVSDLNQIGNKGIGFKAVYSVSSYVIIRSEINTFRFDKHDIAWQSNPDEWPWQLTPIWTVDEEFPDEIKPQLKNDNTIKFILKLDEKFLLEVRRGLEALFANAGSIIFLKKITILEFNDIPQKKSRKIELQGPSKKLETAFAAHKEFVDEQLTAKWGIFNESYEIPDEIKTLAIKHETLATKYKTMENMRISMAIRVVNGTVNMLEVKRVYCYLPTEINWPFPFAMSSDFLLDTGRANLVLSEFEKEWNASILNNLFYIQFNFIKRLAGTNLWKMVVNLFVDPNEIAWGNLESEKENFTVFFNDGIKEIPFLKNMNSRSKLLKNLKFDIHGFVQQFGDTSLKDTCIHHEIINIERLKKYNLSIFDVNAIIQKLKNTAFQKSMCSEERNLDLINFLYNLHQKLETNIKNPEYIALNNFLKNEPFLLNTRGQLKKTADIYFYSQDYELLYDKFEFISLIPRKIEEDESIKRWLKKLGVITLLLSIIIKEANNHLESLVEVGKILFQMHLTGKFKIEDRRNDYVPLKMLKLKTTQTVFLESEKCYLPQALNPTAALEEIIPIIHFVCSDYWTATTNRAELKKFFIAIGVTETINEANLAEIIKTANKHQDRLILATRALHNAHQHSNLPFAANPEKLKLKATDGKYYPANKLYLPDHLDPKYKLETLQLDIPILLVNELNIHDREFFIDLGVLSSLNAYLVYYKSFEELSRCSSHFKDYVIGFTQFEKIECYIHFDFIDQILLTPIFWEVLVNNWQTIKNELKPQRVYKGTHEKTISSIVFFLVNKAIKHLYKIDKTEDIYTPRLKNCLGDEAKILPIAEIASILNDEQLNVLKFKKTLLMEDCLLLLEEIAKKEICKDIKPIVYIYEQMLKNLRELPEYEWSTPKPHLKLLSQRDTFVEREKAFAMMDTDNMLQGSPFLLKRPAQISQIDFEKLCEYFQIETFTKQNVIVNADDPIKTNIPDLLRERLNFLILFECTTESILPKDYIKKHGTLLLKRLSPLEILTASCITISFENVYTELVDCFEDIQNSKIYFLNISTHSVLNQLYEAISHYLRLQIKPADMSNILDSSPDILMKRHFFLTQEKIDLVIEALNNINDDEPQPAVDFSDAPKRQIDSSEVEDSSAKRVKMIEQESTVPAPEHLTYSFVRTPFTTGTSRSTFFTSTHNRNNFPSEIERKRIGQSGEAYVYKILKKHYTTKYGVDTYTETDEGFDITKPDFSLKVLWHNKNCNGLEDSGEPQDFTIIKNGITKKIEVKSTSSDTNTQCYLSSNEEKVMQEFKDRYKIFRVFNSGKDTAFHSTIKNPAEKIANGEIIIEPQTYVMKLK